MLTPTELFKCLADDTRLRCLVLLHQEKRLCVCELTYSLAMSQPKISRHLALLRQIKVVQDSREGQWVYYQINAELPAWVNEILDVIAQETNQRAHIQEDRARLQAMASRPWLNKC
jgi:ArsR family transcriptional regulator